MENHIQGMFQEKQTWKNPILYICIHILHDSIEDIIIFFGK